MCLIPSVLVLHHEGTPLYQLSYKIYLHIPKLWCPWRDLNPQSLRNLILSQACIPFHHKGNVKFNNVKELVGFSATNRQRRNKI